MNSLKKITVYFRRKLNGWVFTVSPLDRELIKQAFPQAIPVTGIDIADSIRTDFEQLHGSLEKYILPVLTGLESNTLKQISIEFLNSTTNISTPFVYE